VHRSHLSVRGAGANFSTDCAARRAFARARRTAWPALGQPLVRRHVVAAPPLPFVPEQSRRSGVGLRAPTNTHRARGDDRLAQCGLNLAARRHTFARAFAPIAEGRPCERQMIAGFVDQATRNAHVEKFGDRIDAVTPTNLEFGFRERRSALVGRGRDGPSPRRVRAARRTDPSEQDYRTGLLPRVRTSKRSSGVNAPPG